MLTCRPALQSLQLSCMYAYPLQTSLIDDASCTAASCEVGRLGPMQGGRQDAAEEEFKCVNRYVDNADDMHVACADVDAMQKTNGISPTCAFFTVSQLNCCHILHT